jgi:hypothetical protein
MKISMQQSKQRLALLWFIGAGCLMALLILQTMLGKYSGQERDAWGWFLPNIMPVLSLIVSVFIVDAKNKDEVQDTIERFYFRFAYGLSLAYLLTITATILIEPFTQYPPLKLLNLSNIWLGAFQGLVAASVGIFFTKTDKRNK